MILASVLGLGLVSLGLIGAQTDGSGADLELLKRLLSPPGGEPRIVEIALGRLPEAWPAEIPIPEEAELIGGLAHSDGTVQVRFSVSWDPETLALFYRQALVSKGWSPSEAAPAYLPGFCLCRGNEAVFVVAAQEGAHTEAAVYYYPAYPLCSPEDGQRRVLPQFVHRAPVSGGGGGSSGAPLKSEEVWFELVSTEKAAELERFYREQFLEAGWELVDQGTEGAAAWSRFRKRDEWGAMLLVIETLKPGTRVVFAMATRLGR